MWVRWKEKPSGWKKQLGLRWVNLNAVPPKTVIIKPVTAAETTVPIY